MSYKSPSSTLGDMNDREIAALERATAQLRAAQPPKPLKPPSQRIPPKKSGVPGIYWRAETESWLVHLLTGKSGGKIYVGITKDLELAKQMQARALNDPNSAAKP